MLAIKALNKKYMYCLLIAVYMLYRNASGEKDRPRIIAFPSLNLKFPTSIDKAAKQSSKRTEATAAAKTSLQLTLAAFHPLDL